jgi:hypothetical protein
MAISPDDGGSGARRKSKALTIIASPPSAEPSLFNVTRTFAGRRQCV